MVISTDVDEQTERWDNSGAQNAHAACLLSNSHSHHKQAPAIFTASDLERLARTVEAEIIPRLLLAHTLERTDVTLTVNSHEPPTEFEIEAFANLLLRRDSSEGLAYTAQLSSRGVHIEDLMLGLLAPAARLLGEFWKEDLCDFTEVTIALSRLQSILREINPLVDADLRNKGKQTAPAERIPRRRVFLTAAPGEQHSFGLTIVEEFFRRKDWGVWGGVALSRKKIIEVARGETFDVIGFSLSCDRFLDDLTSTIRAVRKASRNPDLSVMVGGPLFIKHPEFVARVGADATAVDGQQAVENAQKLTQRIERSKHDTSRHS